MSVAPIGLDRMVTCCTPRWRRRVLEALGTSPRPRRGRRRREEPQVVAEDAQRVGDVVELLVGLAHVVERARRADRGSWPRGRARSRPCSGPRGTPAFPAAKRCLASATAASCRRAPAPPGAAEGRARVRSKGRRIEGPRGSVRALEVVDPAWREAGGLWWSAPRTRPRARRAGGAGQRWRAALGAGGGAGGAGAAVHGRGGGGGGAASRVSGRRRGGDGGGRGEGDHDPGRRAQAEAPAPRRRRGGEGSAARCPRSASAAQSEAAKSAALAGRAAGFLASARRISRSSAAGTPR